MKYLIGIDEVGRGPLAGPVTVCAFMIRAADRAIVRKFSRGIKDSKQLSPEEREDWLVKIEHLARKKLARYELAFVSNSVIDKKGIAPAIRLALGRTLTRLGVSPKECSILLDGALFAPPQFKNQKTIIKGDEKEFLISLASIVAKVHRDRLMVSMAKKYPGYGFEIHKGYGTAVHRKHISQSGPCRIHRRSFLKNIAFLR